MRRSLPIQVSGLFLLVGCSSSPPRTAAADSATAFSSDRITVETRGSGPDLILVPGLSSHRSVWDSVAGPLAAQYRLHLVQVNGFAGFPAGPNAEGPVSTPVAEEIARYISVAGLTKPAVIGHSMGGTIGMMLAARHPELVGYLMVVDMHPFLGAWLGGPQATAESTRPIADQIRAAPDSFATEFGKMVAGMTDKDAIRAAVLQTLEASDRRTIVNSFAELLTTDLRPELGRITAPMTVLYVVLANAGIPPDQYEAGLRAAYANAPNARLVKIDNALHFIQLDQPARLVAEIQALLPR